MDDRASPYGSQFNIHICRNWPTKSLLLPLKISPYARWICGDLEPVTPACENWNILGNLNVVRNATVGASLAWAIPPLQQVRDCYLSARLGNWNNNALCKLSSQRRTPINSSGVQTWGMFLIFDWKYWRHINRGLAETCATSAVMFHYKNGMHSSCSPDIKLWDYCTRRAKKLFLRRLPRHDGYLKLSADPILWTW